MEEKYIEITAQFGTDEPQKLFTDDERALIALCLSKTMYDLFETNRAVMSNLNGNRSKMKISFVSAEKDRGETEQIIRKNISLLGLATDGISSRSFLLKNNDFAEKIEFQANYLMHLAPHLDKKADEIMAEFFIEERQEVTT